MTSIQKLDADLPFHEAETIRQVVESTHDFALCLLDKRGRVVTWSEASERIKGYKAAEILGQNFAAFYPPEDVAAGKPQLALATAEATGRFEDEGWRVCKDGSRVWANVIITPIRQASGVLRGFAKLTRDLTERSEKDRAIRRAHERIRQVVESAPSAMLMTDGAGLIEMVNAQTERLFGYDRADMLGQPVETLVPARFRKEHPDLRGGFYANPISRAMGAGRDLYGRRKDGSEFPIEIGLNPINSDDGMMVLCSIVDISDRKQKEQRLAERTADLERVNDSLRLAYEQVQRHSQELMKTSEELAAARAAAEAANAAKSQFLAIMTHELRTPLTSLIGFSELMLRHDFRPEQLRHFLTLQRNAVTLSSLVTNILDFSKIEAGKSELEILPFEPRAVIAGCQDLVRQPIEAKGLTLHSCVADDVPHWAMGDPTRLRQVVLNLLTNAVKFTEAGSVALTARMTGGRLRLSVQDTGIGVPAAHLGRLFQPFSQVEASTSRRFGGSGLGLAICSRIVEQMGGTIGVESEAGKGSLFWFEIPLPSAAEPDATAMGPMLPAGKSRRVLLAEDNPTNQLLITSMLETVGHHVVVVEDGAAAVDAAATGEFDLVLLDLQMPVMGGFEAARRIRAVEQ